MQAAYIRSKAKKEEFCATSARMLMYRLYDWNFTLSDMRYDTDGMRVEWDVLSDTGGVVDTLSMKGTDLARICAHRARRARAREKQAVKRAEMRAEKAKRSEAEGEMEDESREEDRTQRRPVHAVRKEA